MNVDEMRHRAAHHLQNAANLYEMGNDLAARKQLMKALYMSDQIAKITKLLKSRRASVERAMIMDG